MTPDVWKAIGGILSLVLILLGLYVRRLDEKKKARDEQARDIDAIANADDVTRVADRLRLK